MLCTGSNLYKRELSFGCVTGTFDNLKRPNYFSGKLYHNTVLRILYFLSSGLNDKFVTR